MAPLAPITEDNFMLIHNNAPVGKQRHWCIVRSSDARLKNMPEAWIVDSAYRKLCLEQKVLFALVKVGPLEAGREERPQDICGGDIITFYAASGVRPFSRVVQDNLFYGHYRLHTGFLSKLIINGRRIRNIAKACWACLKRPREER